MFSRKLFELYGHVPLFAMTEKSFASEPQKLFSPESDFGHKRKTILAFEFSFDNCLFFCATHLLFHTKETLSLFRRWFNPVFKCVECPIPND